MSIAIRRMSKQEARQKTSEIADLRISILREFPYSYDGSSDREVQNLARYLDSERAALMGAFAIEVDTVEKLVGVATCLPLIEAEASIQKPFLDSGYKLEEIFYFGESVLEKKYRGQGTGRKFFSEREKFARSFPEIKYTTFCAVQRSENHPLRPVKEHTLNNFWASLGYQKRSKLISQLEWLDVGETQPTKKDMIHWLKTWKKS